MSAVHAHATAHGATAPAAPSGETTRVIVFEAPGRVAMRDASLRVAGDDEAIVDTAFSSISTGTERLVFDGRLPGFPQLRFPLVPGYESVGTIARLGSGVEGLAVGDAVFVGGSSSFTDAAGVFGGQAARTIKRAAQLVPLRGIPLQSAPLLALAATSLHGIRRLGDVAGKRVGVLGAGAIGQFAARFLAAGGAEVVCGDVNPARLAFAADCAVTSVDVRDRPFDEIATGLDAVVEATGDPAQLATCARALRPGGTISLLSYYDELRVPYVDLFVKEVVVVVAREWAHDDLLAARDALANGSVGIGDLADVVLSATDCERAYRTAFSDPSVAKVILSWA